MRLDALRFEDPRAQRRGPGAGPAAAEERLPAASTGTFSVKTVTVRALEGELHSLTAAPFTSTSEARAARSRVRGVGRRTPPRGLTSRDRPARAHAAHMPALALRVVPAAAAAAARPPSGAPGDAGAFRPARRPRRTAAAAALFGFAQMPEPGASTQAYRAVLFSTARRRTRRGGRSASSGRRGRRGCRGAGCGSFAGSNRPPRPRAGSSTRGAPRSSGTPPAAAAGNEDPWGPAPRVPTFPRSRAPPAPARRPRRRGRPPPSAAVPAGPQRRAGRCPRGAETRAARPRGPNPPRPRGSPTTLRWR